MTNNATQYAEAVIKTALHNGMTLAQISGANFNELAKAHLQAQLKATEKAAEQLFEAMTN